jgi:predicted DNA-binding protein YlxM (UPF0122 family)
MNESTYEIADDIIETEYYDSYETLTRKDLTTILKQFKLSILQQNICLMKFNGYSINEIAKHYGLNSSAIYFHYKKAMSTLTEWEKYDWYMSGSRRCHNFKSL